MEDLGLRTLKGLSRPMQVFRVLGRSGASGRFHAITAARGLTRFIGREQELKSVQEVWAEAADGSGRTIVRLREAGIGKSRLLAVAGEDAEHRLHEVFEAECSPYQMNSPLNPIVEMIERRLGSR